MIFELEGDEINFEPKRLIIAGYTGRDRETVEKHVEELKKLGVPAPDTVPAFYTAPVDCLSTATSFETPVTTTSGEVEAVYFLWGNEILIGVGSDHTDRELEKTSVLRSKLITPKPVSKSLWRYSRLKDRWDDVQIRSKVGVEGPERPYQEGYMSLLLRPEDLVSIVAEHYRGDLDGTVIFGGTVPLISEEIHYGGYFEGELFDAVSGEYLKCSYMVNLISYV